MNSGESQLSAKPNGPGRSILPTQSTCCSPDGTRGPTKNAAMSRIKAGKKATQATPRGDFHPAATSSSCTSIAESLNNRVLQMLRQCGISAPAAGAQALANFTEARLGSTKLATK